MTEEQYRLLTAACDRVLLSSESTEERVAIPWLHVLREHPVILSAYEYLFDPSLEEPASESFVATLRRAASRIKRALVPRQKPAAWPGEMPEADILFVSHLLNPALIGKSGDFYFGDVPVLLSARGLRVVIALINHTDEPAQAARKWDDGVTRVVLQGGGRKSRSIQTRMKKESQSLSREAKKTPPGFYKRILEGASRFARRPESAAALSIGEDIGEIVKACSARNLLITHEGHAWERIAFFSARRMRPAVRCAGYNQACLFPLQHALKRNLAEPFNPDHIFTAGRVTKEMLEKAPELQGIGVSVLGSDRGLAEQQRTTPSAAHRLQPVCLVMPEGILSECGILFEFALKAALAMPDVLFRWRLHPAVTFDSVFERYPLLKDLPGNVVLSKDTLEKDFSASQWALYRGTTAVIKAVLEGLRPVYVRLHGELSIDPLFGLSVWRRTVSDVSELRELTAMDRRGHDESENQEFLTAYTYCADYFSAFDADALARVAARA